MRAGNRGVSVTVVVVAGTIAACLGGNPNLSSLDQDSVVVSPGTVQFGMVPIQTTSNPQTILVSPASGSADQSDTVTTISYTCSDFHVDTSSLPASVYRICTSGSGGSTTTSSTTCTSYSTASAMFPVTFSPVVPGPSSCQVTLSGTFGIQTVQLTGTGVAPALAIDVSPPSIDFNSIQQQTTSAVANVTVRNTGSMTLTINSATLQQGAAFAVSGPTGSHTIPPGQFDTLGVTCTPPGSQLYQDNLVVSSNALSSPTVKVPLTCQGINSSLNVTPSPLNLAVTRVGEPVTDTVVVRNTGTATATITAIGLLPTSSPELSIVGGSQGTTMLAGGGMLTVMVSYEAATEHAVSSLGTLRISTPGQDIDVSINGGALTASLAVDPDGINFGPVCIGTQPSASVRLFANAAGSFEVDSVLGGALPFKVMLPTLPAMVMGNGIGGVTFTVGVQPNLAGPLTDHLAVHTDIPGAQPRDVTLSAQVLPQGVTATPNVLDFGTVDASITTPGKEVDLTNCSSGSLNVTDAHIEGDSASDFAIVSPTPIATQLAATQSEQFLVVMSPHASGAKTATMVIDYDGGTASIALDGTALGGDDGSGTTKATYYDCSAGGPAAWWPIALALVPVFGRRRRRQ